MTKVSIVSIGELKEQFYRDAEAEYKKRLGAYCVYENVVLPESKVKYKNDGNIPSILEEEAQNIFARLPPRSYKIALCAEGKRMTSEGFAAFFESKTAQNPSICFVIGGSHGLSDRVKNGCDMKLSLSDMIFPHMLARVVLSEQIYRAYTIINGKRYHK